MPSFSTLSSTIKCWSKIFGLDPDLKSAAKLVQLFFGSNQRYFHNERAIAPSIDQLDFEAQCYSDLLSKTDEDQVDERLSAIEVQVAEPIDLGSQVVAAVVPEPFLENTALMTRFKELSVQPLPYMYMDRWRPIDCTSAIYTAVRDYYRQAMVL